MKLEDLINQQKGEVILQFANQLQIQDSKKKDLGSYYKEAQTKVDQRWNTLEEKLSIISGKSAISLINEWVRTEYKKHCSQAKIISTIRANEIDREMIDVIRSLCL